MSTPRHNSFQVLLQYLNSTYLSLRLTPEAIDIHNSETYFPFSKSAQENELETPLFPLFGPHVKDEDAAKVVPQVVVFESFQYRIVIYKNIYKNKSFRSKLEQPIRAAKRRGIHAKKNLKNIKIEKRSKRIHTKRSRDERTRRDAQRVEENVQKKHKCQ